LTGRVRSVYNDDDGGGLQVRIGNLIAAILLACFGVQ
jgi:hypothetical protein